MAQVTLQDLQDQNKLNQLKSIFGNDQNTSYNFKRLGSLDGINQAKESYDLAKRGLMRVVTPDEVKKNGLYINEDQASFQRRIDEAAANVAKYGQYQPLQTNLSGSELDKYWNETISALQQNYDTTSKNLLDQINSSLSIYDKELARYKENAIDNGYSDQSSYAQRFSPYREQINQLPDWLKAQFSIPTNQNDPANDNRVIDNSKDLAALQQPMQQTQQPTGDLGGTSATVTLPNGQRVSTAYAQQMGYQVNGGVVSGTPPAQSSSQQYQIAAQPITATSVPTGNSSANYVEQLFKQYHGRSANQQELSRYANMTAEQAQREISGGAPTGAVQAPTGYEQIDSPAALEQLAQQAGFNPANIVRVGNKLFKPTSMGGAASDTTDLTDLAATGGRGIGSGSLQIAANGSDLSDANISDAIQSYYDQYVAQIPGSFDEARTNYWNTASSYQNFRTDTYNALNDQYQIDEKSAQLTDLDKQIAAKQQAWDTLIEDNRNQPVSMAMITGREAHIKRMASIEMEGLLAQRAAITGDIERANKKIDTLVELKTKDMEDKISLMKDFYTEQKDFFTKAEDRAYQAAVTKAEQAFEMQKFNLQNVASLMKDYPTAGITMNDDYSSAIAKAAKVPQKGDYSAIANPITGEIMIFDKNTGQFVSTGGNSNQNIVGTADQIAAAIKQVESQGNYNAKGASGEFGAYQFMPDTWNKFSEEYAAANGLNQTVSPTPQNQDAVAQFKISQWLNQGLTPQQIAAAWNSGSPTGWENKRGTNARGVAYDVPAYVNKVTSALAQLGGTQTPTMLNKYQQQKVDTVAKQYNDDPDVKGYVTVRDAYQRVVASAANPTAAGDLSLIFNFMKVLDPGSTVREGEFANAQNAGGVDSKIQGLYNQVIDGKRLADAQRADFLSRATQLYSPKHAQYLLAYDHYSKQLTDEGLNPSDYIRPFDTNIGGDRPSDVPGNYIKVSIGGKLYWVDPLKIANK